MSTPTATQPPSLPDTFHFGTLPENIAALVAEEDDEDLIRVMTPTALFMAGLGAWIKSEIDLGLVRTVVPEELLVSCPLQDSAIRLRRPQSLLSTCLDTARLGRIARPYYFAGNTIGPQPTDEVRFDAFFWRLTDLCA